ncbi:hypothetical protein IL306_006671 [Fusarium sp. DS 682]|nr:hypothetical protein IL306_006671 [Fusarium sp. DS 682]
MANHLEATILKTEMIYNEMAFRNLFGWIPTYMRPPYLDCDAASGCLGLMKQLGYHVINTNLDTKDYEYDGPDLIQSAKDKYSAAVSSNSGSNNYIVLAHDVHEQTVHNLTSYMIQTARNRGYKLVTVGECLGDPKENWYRIVGSQPTQTQASTLVPQPTSTTQPLIVSPNQRCGGTTGYTLVRVILTAELAATRTLDNAHRSQARFRIQLMASVERLLRQPAPTMELRPAAHSTDIGESPISSMESLSLSTAELE